MALAVQRRHRRERPLLRPDDVHLFAGGRIQESSGPELADTLEAEGLRTLGRRPTRPPTQPPTRSETLRRPFFADLLT